jgi:hypothetical protein
MVAVPALMPLAMPVVVAIVDFARLLLLHVPPVGVAARVVLLPVQTAAVPVIATGNAFTVTTAVFIQLLVPV